MKIRNFFTDALSVEDGTEDIESALESAYGIPREIQKIHRSGDRIFLTLQHDKRVVDQVEATAGKDSSLGEADRTGPADYPFIPGLLVTDPAEVEKMVAGLGELERRSILDDVPNYMRKYLETSDSWPERENEIDEAT